MLSFSYDLDEAHDLVQETWVRAYAKRATYAGTGTLLGWLYAVCRNVCRAAVSSGSQRQRLATEAGGWEVTELQGPDRAAERGCLRDSIHQALAELPERERDIVILRLLEGRSTRETAEVLGCAEGTVKAALHHAIKKLERSMEVWQR